MLRVIRITQPMTVPRRGSNDSARRHTRMNVSCVISSASAASRVIAMAAP
jgi:hypothetical protein